MLVGELDHKKGKNMRMFLILATLLIGSTAADAQEWRTMDSAPRDGTVIEIQNNYGVAPWYGIFRYGGKMTIESCTLESDGTTFFPCDNPKFVEVDAGDSWVSVDRPGHGLDPKDERYWKWRPHTDSAPYVDPTGGAQNTAAYWQHR